MGVVPGDDLVTPASDRAAEAADLDGHRLVGEVAGDVVDPGRGEFGVGVVVCLADHLFGVPSHAHLPGRVAGFEQPDEALTTVDGEPLAGHRQQPPAAVERIVFCGRGVPRLVLRASPAFIERAGRDADHVEQG